VDEPIRPVPSGLLGRLFPALGEPQFRTFWLGMAPSMMAIQMGAVAIGFAAFTLSGSATVLGGVSLAIGLPMLVLSLLGGVVADRASRRAVLVGTQTILGVSAAVIAVLALTGHLAVWQLYLLGLAQGTAFAFNMPARQAYIAEIVAAPQLRSAVTLNNATMNFARVAGPSLAGGILAVPALGAGVVFAAMAAMYSGVIAALFRLPAPAVRERSSRAGGLTQLVDGLRYIRSSSRLMGLLVLGFVPLFFGMPFQSLLPVFAERVHAVGAAGLGAMSASVGAGALAGSVAIAVLSRSRHLGKIQVGLGTGFGLSLVGFALSPTFLLALVLLVAVGFSSAGYSALNQTLVMENTAPQFHGRVMSVYLMTYGMIPFATFPEAWLADHIGAPTAMAGAGALVALAVLLAITLIPSSRQVD
jgi:MFS transporter, DHA1 family, staphyloferrin A biosynthesis exporter